MGHEGTVRASHLLVKHRYACTTYMNRHLLCHKPARFFRTLQLS